MPSTSPAQHRLMEAAAHTPGGFGGVPQSVGKEFAMKDAYPTDPVEMGDTTTKLDAACSKMDALTRRMDACEARAAARRVDARVRGDGDTKGYEHGKTNVHSYGSLEIARHHLKRKGFNEDYTKDYLRGMKEAAKGVGDPNMYERGRK